MIIATLLIRDEEDIIKKNIEHHLNNGVDYFIITDNGSKDKSLEIINEFKQVLEVIHEKEQNYHQSEWVTKMALKAIKYDPDWIVHLDADEFWKGFDFLEDVNKDIKVIKSSTSLDPKKSDGTTCRDHVVIEQIPEEFNFKNMPYYRTSEYRPNKGCKIIHRPDKKIQILQGNHDAVSFSGRQIFTKRITIDHYPVRSYSHFERKVINGGSSYKISNLPLSTGSHWRKWYEIYEKGKLKEEYNKMIYNKEKIIQQISNGKLFVDNMFDENLIKIYL